MDTSKQLNANELIAKLQELEKEAYMTTVSVLLGHSNISTTLNLYVHPNMEQKKRCISKMFKSLGK